MSGFKSRADQLEYVYGRFINWMEDQLVLAGSAHQNLDFVRAVPGLTLTGMAMDLTKKHGESLRHRDLGAIYKVIVDQFPSNWDAEGIVSESKKVFDWIKMNSADKFFTYTDVIMKLLE